MADAGFVQQQCPLFRHGNQHISGTHFLQFSGIGFDLTVTVQRDSEQFSQFIMVGLDEKRLVLQHVFQEVFGGIDYSSNLFPFQMCQNLFIGV